MRPDNHTQLLNNCCLCHLLFLFRSFLFFWRCLFFRVFFTILPFRECRVRCSFFLPGDVFPPCGHGLDFDISLFENSTNKNRHLGLGPARNHPSESKCVLVQTGKVIITRNVTWAHVPLSRPPTARPTPSRWKGRAVTMEGTEKQARSAVSLNRGVMSLSQVARGSRW